MIETDTDTYAAIQFSLGLLKYSDIYLIFKSICPPRLETAMSRMLAYACATKCAYLLCSLSAHGQGKLQLQFFLSAGLRSGLFQF